VERLGRQGRAPNARSACARRRTDAAEPSRNCRSGDVRRRPADGRKRSDVCRALRLHGDPRQDGTGRFRRNDRNDELRRRATRQVLEHLARRAVVVRGMRRTSRDIGRVVVMMMLVRLGAVVPVCVFVRGDRDAGGEDPRQRPQRGPDQRQQHAGSDPRTPARVSCAPVASLRTTRWTHQSAVLRCRQSHTA
jgi:hypothetical protein